MAAVLIGYDLNKEKKSRDGYAALIDAIKKNFASRWHCLDSTWIVITDKTSVQVHDLLKPHIDVDDELFVVKLTRDAAWTGFTKNCSDWLKNNL